MHELMPKTMSQGIKYDDVSSLMSPETMIRQETYDDISIRIEELPDLLRPYEENGYFTDDDILTNEQISDIREGISTEELCIIDRNCNDDDVYQVLLENGVLDQIAGNLGNMILENGENLQGIEINKMGSNVHIRYCSAMVQMPHRN